MRNDYTKVFKMTFHKALCRCRADLGISQDEMANRLEMGCRSYVDLDHGKSGCCALTLALFLVYVCEEPLSFLNDLRYAFEKCKTETQ